MVSSERLDVFIEKISGNSLPPPVRIVVAPKPNISQITEKILFISCNPLSIEYFIAVPQCITHNFHKRYSK